MLQFSRLDGLQNTGFDRLKIVELFGPVFLKLREARRKETFHTITDFTLSHVLKAGFHMIADDRGSRIADRKKFCDRLRSYGNTLLRS